VDNMIERAPVLLPCPLCGSGMEFMPAHCKGDNDWIRHAPKTGGYNCPIIEISGFNLDGDLVTAWNTRPTSPSPAPAGERL
jgi:hypothetical protein